MAIDPSPTPLDTRLIESCRTSPAQKESWEVSFEQDWICPSAIPPFHVCHIAARTHVTVVIAQ